MNNTQNKNSEINEQSAKKNSEINEQQFYSTAKNPQ